jgi:hypothetical protein
MKHHRKGRALRRRYGRGRGSMLVRRHHGYEIDVRESGGGGFVAKIYAPGGAFVGSSTADSQMQALSRAKGTINVFTG